VTDAGSALGAGSTVDTSKTTRRHQRADLEEKAIPFESHIGNGGGHMPLTGKISSGENFFCPHCGALYAVTHSRASKTDSNIAKCVVCGHTMDKWESTTVPIYSLVHRPEDA
jgi:predicted RNA-binding Zn-ribbon protein involved in translation (DUF1610 family)